MERKTNKLQWMRGILSWKRLKLIQVTTVNNRLTKFTTLTLPNSIIKALLTVLSVKILLKKALMSQMSLQTTIPNPITF